MQLTLKALVLALALVSSLGVQAADDPVFARLKTFRNYFWLTGLQPARHHFVIWFDQLEGNRCEAAGNSVEEIAALADEDLNCAYGAFGIPPEEVPAVPEEMRALAQAAQARVLRFAPEARGLKIQYSGQFRRAALTELIPGTTVGTGEHSFRMAIWSELSLKLDEAAQSVELHGFSMLSSITSVCTSFMPERCATLPTFIDYSVPDKHKGTLIANKLASYPEEAALIDKELRNLKKALFKAVRAIDEGKYRNPIERILERQGERALPRNFRQHVKYEFSIYGRTAVFSDQVEARVVLKFPVKRAARAPVTVTETYPALGGLKVTGTLDLQSKTLTVRYEARTGSGETRFAVAADSLIVDGRQTAFPISTDLALSSGQEEARLPGYDSFTGVDLYIRSGSLLHSGTIAPR